MLKPLFLPTANAGVIWHRMFQFFRYMRDHKLANPAMDKYDPNHMRTQEWQWAKYKSTVALDQIQRLMEMADVIVVGYIVQDYGLAILQACKELFKHKPILLEIDDYCLDINNYSPAHHAYKPGSEAPEAIMAQMKTLDGVIVSTPYLKKQYAEYNNNIYIIPNTIDFNIWDKLKPGKPKNKRIRIGWCGAATHNEDLAFIKPIIYKLLDKYSNIEFFFAAGAPQFFIKKHKRIICNNAWHNPYDYPQSLKSKHFDIGLAPLLDNNFNRGKSNLRWLEYSALKIPTVASNVEPFRRSIEHGYTGFLAKEQDDWFNYLSQLIESEQYRKTMGDNAYWQVKKDFNLKQVTKDYVDLLQGEVDEFKRFTSKVPSRSPRSRHKRSNKQPAGRTT